MICLVTDRRRLAPDARTDRDACAAVIRQCEEAALAGVDAIQVRERDLDARPLTALVRDVVGLVRGTKTMVLVNDRADVAVAADAHGVHLRSDSVSSAAARTVGAPSWIVGRSVHDAAEARAESAANYVMFGTVFPTASKPGQQASGVGALADAIRASAAPVIAIGGITPETTAQVARAGAAGVAAISVFFPRGRAVGALGAGPAVAALREAFDRGQNGRVE